MFEIYSGTTTPCFYPRALCSSTGLQMESFISSSFFTLPKGLVYSIETNLHTFIDNILLLLPQENYSLQSDQLISWLCSELKKIVSARQPSSQSFPQQGEAISDAQCIGETSRHVHYQLRGEEGSPGSGQRSGAQVQDEDVQLHQHIHTLIWPRNYNQKIIPTSCGT